MRCGCGRKKVVGHEEGGRGMKRRRRLAANDVTTDAGESRREVGKG